MRTRLLLSLVACLLAASPVLAAAPISPEAMSSDKSADIAKTKTQWMGLSPEAHLQSVKELLDAENKKAGGKKPKYDTGDDVLRAVTDCTNDLVNSPKDPANKEKDTASLRSIVIKKCSDGKIRKDLLTISAEKRARERWLGLSIEDRVRNLLELLNASKATPAEKAATDEVAPFIQDIAVDKLKYNGANVRDILSDHKYDANYSEVEIEALLGCANKMAAEPLAYSEKLKATLNDSVMACQKDFPKWLPTAKVKMSCMKDKLKDYPQKGDLKLPNYKITANDDTAWKPSSPRLRQVIKAMRSCGTAFIRTSPPQKKPEGADAAPAKQ